MSDTLPHNLDAEQAVLGTLLEDSRRFHEVADALTASSFWDPLHGRIFEWIEKHVAKGMRADPISLKSVFEQDAAIQEIGGIGYLADLVLAGRPVETAREYARLVADAHLKRRAIEAARTIEEAAQDGEKTGGDVVDLATGALFDLGEREDTPDPVSIIDAMRAGFDLAQEEGGLRTGLSALDDQAGKLLPGQFIVIAARPGMGKTVAGVEIGLNAAISTKRAVLFFSYEMGNGEIGHRLASTLADRLRPGLGPTYKQIGERDYTTEQSDILQEAMQYGEAINFHVIDAGRMTAPQVLGIAERWHRKNPLALIVVDYLQLIRSHIERRGQRSAEVGDISKALKQGAKRLGVPLIALSQLNRAVEMRPDKRPRLADLRESGDIEQDADKVIMLYRPAYYANRQAAPDDEAEHGQWMLDCASPKLEFMIEKNRQGPTGTADQECDVTRSRVWDQGQDRTADTLAL